MMKMHFDNTASYIYITGAVLFAVMQITEKKDKENSFVLRRLVVMQTLGALILVIAGILMFTHNRNEWVVAMTIGALLELYTSFRIPEEKSK